VAYLPPVSAGAGQDRGSSAEGPQIDQDGEDAAESAGDGVVSAP